MRAILQDRYGSPEHLRVGVADKPEPTAEQVLVRVRASSVNAGDWRRVRGAPAIIRMVEGLRRPRSPLFGGDAAGVVEAVGSGVTHLQPGDEVFGIRSAAFAEYLTGKNFVRKPANLSFDEAAALPIAGVTALQAVRDHGRVRPGDRVLVNGAGGGVGTMSVQIAKACGATVTALTGPRGQELMRSIGADEVVDYSRDDFTRGGRRYDVVIDMGGNRSIRHLRRILKPDGRLVLVGAGRGSIGPMTRLLGGMLRTRVLRQRNVATFIATVARDDLDELRALAESGGLRPVIEATYRFEEIPDAVARLERGGVLGKLVIRMSD